MAVGMFEVASEGNYQTYANINADSFEWKGYETKLETNPLGL